MIILFYAVDFKEFDVIFEMSMLINEFIIIDSTKAS